MTATSSGVESHYVTPWEFLVRMKPSQESDDGVTRERFQAGQITARQVSRGVHLGSSPFGLSTANPAPSKPALRRPSRCCRRRIRSMCIRNDANNDAKQRILRVGERTKHTLIGEVWGERVTREFSTASRWRFSMDAVNSIQSDINSRENGGAVTAPANYQHMEQTKKSLRNCQPPCSRIAARLRAY